MKSLLIGQNLLNGRFCTFHRFVSLLWSPELGSRMTIQMLLGDNITFFYFYNRCCVVGSIHYFFQAIATGISRHDLDNNKLFLLPVIFLCFVVGLISFSVYIYLRLYFVFSLSRFNDNDDGSFDFFVFKYSLSFSPPYH